MKIPGLTRNLAGVRFTVLLVLLPGILPARTHAFELWEWPGGDDSVDAVLEGAEPYIEIHTGPGRGYPVFHVIEQGESIEILMRRTGWYQIMSADGKTGWALAHTLEPTDMPVGLPEVKPGDYLKSRWRIGFTSGFIDSSNTFSVTAGYRPFSWVGMEIEAGKIFGQSVTSNFYGDNFMLEPRPDWPVSPFIIAGAGQLSIDSRHKYSGQRHERP